MTTLYIILYLFIIVAPLGLFGYWKGRRVATVKDAQEFNLQTQFAIKVVVFIHILLVAFTVYEFLYEQGWELTGAMFVGVPSVIAIFMVITRQFQRPFFATFLAITVFLGSLVAISIEGFVCIVFAAPVYYSIGFLVVFTARWAFKKANGYAGRILLLAIIIFLSLEGVVPGYSHNKHYTVVHTDIIELPIKDVRYNLSQNPDFDALPTYLLQLIGLPIPIAAHGQGMKAGDQREFVFQRRDGETERVVFSVLFSDANSAILAPVKDDTVISQWLGWQKTVFQWKSIDEHTTQIDIAMSFERRISPAWYFGPMQKLMVKQAARVLVEHGRQLMPVHTNTEVNIATR